MLNQLVMAIYRIDANGIFLNGPFILLNRTRVNFFERSLMTVPGPWLSILLYFSSYVISRSTRISDAFPSLRSASLLFSAGSVLLKQRPAQPVPDISPFQIRPFNRCEPSEVCNDYAQLLTEMLLRLPYQVTADRIHRYCRTNIAFFSILLPTRRCHYISLSMHHFFCLP